MERINGVNINTNTDNHMYQTKDTLKCDVCGKMVKSVYALRLKDDDNAKFACYSKCVNKLMKEMFVGCDDEYIEIIGIEDILFVDRKETKKRVRSEMTLKLRYTIMKRDNFKCVICGNTMPNAELCVDHIIPVCKGGSNVETNLRTLCNLCNAGKGGE